MQARDLFPGLFRELGVKPAGEYCVDLNVVLGPGERQALGQLDDAPLGRRVGCGERRAKYRGHAADIHDLAAARFLHERVHGLRHQEGTRQVGVQDLLPLGERQVLGLLADVDAGVIEKNVDAAKVLDDFGDGPVDIVGFSHVAGDDEGVGAHLGLKPLRGHLRLLGVSAQDDDLGPRLGQALGDAQADTAVAPGHDRHLAGQVEQVHVGLRMLRLVVDDRISPW